METYNRIAGQSLERIAALSDGVFAIAMTLLVLDLKVPAGDGIHTEIALWQRLIELSPRVLTFLLSCLTLGIFWLGQQTQLSHLARGNRDLAWLHIVFLFIVSLMPFSTGLLAEYIQLRVALLVYWLNILLLGATLFASWRYAVRTDLVRQDAPEEICGAIERRIIIAQGLYAICALLCFWSTYASIAAIVLVQLNYAIAPRLRRAT